MKGRNEETFLPVFSRPRSNMCFNTFASLRVWEQELYGLNHQSSLEGGNVILLWSNRWRWPQSLPTTGPRCFQKWYQRQRWWRSVQKGKRKKGPKFADVWRQIKSWAALQLFFIWWRAFLNVSVASVAARCERRCTKILPSIQSVLIRLACPSASSRIWISGRAGAGVAHVPGSLRVPSTACQYAQNTADQCLLNHFPNRGNDNYKKWRLCTLCKCCAMTLEPNGPSY